MSVDTGRREFGGGPLARATGLVYTLLSAELLFLLTVAPGVAVLLLLDRDAGNLPLAAACAAPVGPAVSALFFLLHNRSGDLADLHPARAFWRGYRANLRGVLAIWLPLLTWLTILAVNVAYREAAGLPGWWLGPLVAVAVVAVLWGVNALVITSLFTFRVRDVARLAGYFLIRRPSVPLGSLGVLAVAVCVTALWSEAVLMLLAPILALALLWTSRPMIADIRAEFTVDAR